LLACSLCGRLQLDLGQELRLAQQPLPTSRISSQLGIRESHNAATSRFFVRPESISDMLKDELEQREEAALKDYVAGIEASMGEVSATGAVRWNATQQRELRSPLLFA